VSEEQRLAGVERLAGAYFRLLSVIDWDDAVLVAGLREGLNNFVSNAHLASFPGRNKYHKTHFVSPSALQRLERTDYRGLVWEHLVPKRHYIQKPCEEQARAHTLTVDFIRDRLRRFWFLATVMREEDRLLVRACMPVNWDEVDVHARYGAVAPALTLIPNPFFERCAEKAARLD
jgi:hypothetical protein